MRAVRKNIHVAQGATNNFAFKIKQGGVAVSLSGATLRGAARKNLADAAAAFTFQSEITDAAAGEGRFFLDPADTTGLTLDSSANCEREVTCYQFDFEIEFADGTVWRIREGVAYVSPEATQ